MPFLFPILCNLLFSAFHNTNERAHLEEPMVKGRILLKGILKK
jgi:hypothetical protein